MLRRLAFVLLPVALLAAACSGGSGGIDDSSQQESPDSPVAVRDADIGDSGSSGADESVQGEPSEPPAATGDTDAGDGGDGSSGALFSTLNPLQLLGSIGEQPGAPAISQDVDPSLKAALLDAGDLPADFLPQGDSAFSIPSEFGTMEMAASMFASGDMMNGDLGAMVMSAVIALPPDAIDELGDLSELQEFSQADLDAVTDESAQFGIQFGDVRALDASGLGDAGIGMHIAMDFGGFLEVFEVPDEDVPFEGIAIDMYMFLRGERMLVVMVMWSTGEPPGVDGRTLAEVMDEKAAAGS